MVYLKLFYAAFFPALLGFCFINIFLSRKEDAPFFERIALGFCAGLMLITLEMCFVLSRLNIKFSVLAISLPLVPIILAGIFVTAKNKLIDLRLPRISSLSKLEIFLLIMILFQVFFVFSTQMIKPVSGWDAWSNYSLRAKAYFMEGTSNVPAMPYTVRGQHDSLQQTWIFVCIDRWNEVLGKLNFPLYYISLIAIFYYAVRRNKTRLISLISTFILASLPFLFYHATLEYCDLLLGIYLFSGVSLLFLWFNKPESRYLLLSCVFLVPTITIKSEAYFHLVIVALIFAFSLFSKRMESSRDIKIIRNTTIVCILLGAAYMIRMIFFGSHEAARFSANLIFSRILPLFSVFADYIFIRPNWSIVWPILILLIIFNHKKLKDNFNMSLLGLVLLELFGFMAYYFTAAEDIYGWLFYVTPALRNMLQFMPITVFLIANLLSLESPDLIFMHTSKLTKTINEPTRKSRKIQRQQ